MNVCRAFTDEEWNKFYIRVLRWNYKRDNTKFNLELEERMLAEELSEFYTALAEGDIVEMLDALGDYLFVYAGTLAKASFTEMRHSTSYDISYNIFDHTRDNVTKMYDLLWSELKDYLIDELYPEARMANLVLNTCELIIEANELKPTTKVDGKIVKGDKYKEPQPKIAEMVSKVTQQRTNSIGATLAAQAELRHAIAVWADKAGKAAGRSDSELYRLFYLTFGVDVPSAKALGAKEAEELRLQIEERSNGTRD